MADGGAPEGISDEVRAPMCQMHNLAIEFYCQKHDKTVCRTCKLMEHRKCQLQTIEHAAAEIRALSRNVVVLEQFEEISTKMEKIGAVLGDEREILESYKNTAIEEIKRTMKEIEALGRKKIAEVEEIFRNESKNLDEETRALAESKMLVDKTIKELNTATNVGTEEEIFVATKTAEHDMPKFEDIVEESRHLSHPEIAFTLDRKLANVQTFGDVSVERRSATVVLTPDVTEVLNTEETHIGIAWFDKLPGDRMILLNIDIETSDSQLRLYSTNKKLLSQLDLSAALSADILNDHQVIVALVEDQKLQVININSDDLTTGPVINTDVTPMLILKYSDYSVLVMVADERKGKYCFKILDLTGKVEKNIKLSTELERPSFMRINNEKNGVYIVDRKNGCLGFNVNGDEIFHYTSTDYDYYFGLGVDARGALYFSAGKEDGDPSCVLKLSPAGQVLRQLDIRGKYPLQCIGIKLYLSNTRADGKVQKETCIFCSDV